MWNRRTERSAFIAMMAVLVGQARCTSEIPVLGQGGSSSTADGGMTVGFAAQTVGATTISVTVGASGVSTGTGTQCTALTPVGAVTFGTTSTATGGCNFESSDSAHQYVAQCTPEGCDCLVDGALNCSCTDNSPTDCTTGCCPMPWADTP